MASLKQRRGGQLLLSYAISFSASVLQILYLPLLSVYALRIGIGEDKIGLISGVGALIYALVTPLAGSASSQLGVPRTLMLSLLALSASYAVLPYLRDAPSLAMISLLAYLSYALLWPSLESIIAQEGGSTSNFSASWSTGTLLGSALVSFLLQLPESMCFSLLSASILPFIPLVARARVAHHRDEVRLSDAVEAAASLFNHLKLSFAYAASLGGVLAFYPLIVETRTLPVWLVSLSLFTMIGARTITFITYSLLPEAVKGRPILGALLLAPLATLPYLNEPPLVAAVSVLAGIGQGLLYTTALNEVFTKGGRGAHTGVFESSIGLGYVSGPIIAGMASRVALELSIPAAVAVAVTASLLPPVVSEDTAS